MEWNELDFSLGFVGLYRWQEAELARRKAAAERYDRLSALNYPERPPAAELAAIAAETEARAPLWMQIVGFNPWTARLVGPDERRAGIVRLLNVVATVFEVELGKNSKFKHQKSKWGGRLGGSDGAYSAPGAAPWTGRGGAARVFSGGQDGGGACEGEAGDAEGCAVAPSPTAAERRAASALSPLGEGLTGGAGRIFSGRQDAGGPDGTLMPREFYDPLVTLCFYLGIARARLSALCLEETGLTALEFLDRIRVRDFRAELTEQTRADVAEWLEYLEREDEVVSDHDWNVVAQRFLKWRRGTGRGVVRQRWAWSLGLATRGRLSKAVFLTDGLTLEELELEVACEVVKRAANADPEPMTMERSELREMFDAPGAEKAEPPEDGISIEPQRDGDTEKGEGTEGEGSVRGELDSSLEGLGAGEVA